jgi:hypothetical protein
MKPADQMSPADFGKHLIWEFASDLESDLADETYMRPVLELPVSSMSGRVVGTNLTLANGQTVFGVLANLDLTDAASTRHFLTVTVFRGNGERFDLARYHDIDYPQNGPDALANFLGLPLSAVFPIVYDVSEVAVGGPDCVRGRILAVPESPLSRSALIQLAVRTAPG